MTPRSPAGSLKDKKIPKQYPGQSKAKITNEMPAPVPLFLRAGSLIFLNEPKLRSKDLDSQFLILAALGQKSLSASGEILGIQAYGNEDNIKHCLANGCTAKITITMNQQKENQVNQIFTIKSEGKGIKNTIKIKAMRVWHEDRQWRHTEQILLEGEKIVKLEFNIV